MNKKQISRAKARKSSSHGDRFHTLADVGKHFHLPEVEIDVSVTGRSASREMTEALLALVAGTVKKKSVDHPAKSRGKRA